MKYLWMAIFLCSGMFAQAQLETDPVYMTKKDRQAAKEARRKKREAEISQVRFQNPDYQPNSRNSRQKTSSYRYWDRRYATARAPRLSVGIGYGMPSWYGGYGYRNGYFYDDFYDPWFCQRGYWGLNSWNSYSSSWGFRQNWAWSNGSLFYDPYCCQSYNSFYNPFFLQPSYYYSRPSYVPRRRANPPAPIPNTSPNTIRRTSPSSYQNNSNYNPSNNYRPSPSFTPSNQRGSSGSGGSMNRGGSGGGANSPSPGIRRPR